MVFIFYGSYLSILYTWTLTNETYDTYETNDTTKKALWQ